MIPASAFRVAQPSAGSRRPHLWLIAGGIALAGLAAYLNTFSVPFFFDDLAAITRNPSIRRLFALSEVLRPPPDGSGVSGRPLVNLTLAINYALGGTAVGGYHAGNLILHVLAGLALFAVVRRTARLPLLNPDARDARTGRLAGAATSLAATVALLWLLHPLQTESVTCVIQRTELLTGFFLLAVFYCFLRSLEAGGQNRWAALSVAACYCGMATKEVMVVAPLLVFCFDRSFVTGSWRTAWSLRRSFYLGLATSWIVLALLVAAGGGTRGAAAGFGLGVSWWSYALKQCEAIWLYLRLAVWPHPLVADYGTEVVTDLRAVLVPAVGLLALVVGVAWALVRRPRAGFMGLWFFAILAPSSSVVPLVTQTVAEHRMYLPLVAVLALATLAIHTATGRRGLWALGAGAGALGVATFCRNDVYRSELSLWADTVARAPRVARAQANLGVALKRAGREAEALRQYQIALALDPGLATGHSELGLILLRQRKLPEARQAFETALRLNPRHPEALNNLGILEVELGESEAAARHFAAALALQPLLAPAHSNLAGVLIGRGQLDEARRHAELALAEEPHLPDAHYNLGRVHLLQGRPAEAIPCFQQALASRPDYTEARHNLGVAYLQTRRTAEAIAEFAATLRLQPQNAPAHNNLGSAFFQMGRLADAEKCFRGAIAADPQSADSHSNLAIVLAQTGRNEEAIREYDAALRLNPNHALARRELENLRARGHSATAPP